MLSCGDCAAGQKCSYNICFGGATDDAGVPADLGAPPPKSGGCGCFVAARSSADPPLVLFAVVGLALVFRRRRHV
jgi:hypothetical protein